MPLLWNEKIEAGKSRRTYSGGEVLENIGT